MICDPGGVELSENSGQLGPRKDHRIPGQGQIRSRLQEVGFRIQEIAGSAHSVLEPQLLASLDFHVKGFP